MIGLPSSRAVVAWLDAVQELEALQRVERRAYIVEGRLYREALAEVGLPPVRLVV